MARIVSLIVLVVILLVIAALFFKVMADFLVPMFLALLLAVIFGPVNRWLFERSHGYKRVAAALTTVLILLIVLIPLLLVLLQAARESVAIYNSFATPEVESSDTQPEEAESAGSEEIPPTKDEETADNASGSQLSIKEVAEGIVERGVRLGAISPAKRHKMTERLENALSAASDKVVDNLQKTLMPLALSTPGYIGHFVLGAFVMIVSLYYFLVDGPGMVHSVMKMSPLEDKYESELIGQFVSLSRTMVIATLLSALAQGLLAGVGFFFVGVGSVFLLTTLALLFAMIPFIGAAAVWVPVCLWLYLIDGRTTAAVVLAIYCIAIVSMADNIIKPVLLHGRANLHPLLALLSVLGGVAALGPIGIFVGPMAVVFLQTLLNMLHTEIESLSEEPPAVGTAGGDGP